MAACIFLKLKVVSCDRKMRTICSKEFNFHGCCGRKYFDQCMYSLGKRCLKPNLHIHSSHSSQKKAVELIRYNSTGDSLDYKNGMMFTTYDRDNDESGSNCAVAFRGAWWHRRNTQNSRSRCWKKFLKLLISFKC